ncbi:MAG: MCE family protein [Flexistipes sinusarabici]|uniref:MCE family protein n=1 Tax=Flexistipes sinusarabici TaxID=2352 RepID=A0A5D0MR07_FLESI|nr:MlaD family protein [Flexistipes sinusarabici]TYB34190.1 MAG: MCE family protein [Flexistipes sinusarabici]
MISKKVKFFVGLFVLIGAIILIGAILWLSSVHFYSSGKLYAAYFDESVQGLEVGSAVKYRGINIGRIKQIGIAKNSRYIEVVLELNNDFTLTKDMVAQLKTVGITGFIYIEIDIIDKKEIGMLTPDFTSKYEVIPTVKSDISQIMQSVSEITEEFKSIELSKIANNINRLIKKLDYTINAMSVGQISEQLKTSLTLSKNMLKDLDKLINNIDKTVVTNRREIDNFFRKWGNTSTELNLLIRDISSIVKNNDKELNALPKKLITILNELEYTVSDMDKLINSLKDQPSVIFAPPPERSILDE